MSRRLSGAPNRQSRRPLIRKVQDDQPDRHLRGPYPTPCVSSHKAFFILERAPWPMRLSLIFRPQNRLRAELRRRRLALSPRSAARQRWRWRATAGAGAAPRTHPGRLSEPRQRNRYRPFAERPRARLPRAAAGGARRAAGGCGFTALDARPRWRANRYGIPECLGPRVPLSRATHVLLLLCWVLTPPAAAGQGGGFLMTPPGGAARAAGPRQN